MKKVVFNYLIFVTFAALAVFSSCNKENDNKTDVYVAGIGINEQGIAVAKLWKNEVVLNLSNIGSGANSVYVSGRDVYIVGYEESKATLWKNGVAQYLNDGTRNASANSVYVSGSDVYVAGNPNIAYTSAILWKNGISQYLVKNDNTVHARANSVYVSGVNVYAAGNQIVYISAALWRNGIAQNLNDGTSWTEALSVYVLSDGITYVAGYGVNAQNLFAAKLWKNGVSLSHQRNFLFMC